MVNVSVIDLGIGNLFSVASGFRRLGCQVDVVSADHVGNEPDMMVLPGVGNFRTACEKLEAARPSLEDQVHAGRLLFGICLGYQLLFESSEEGEGEGLRLLGGRVAGLPKHVKVPHMGWNSLDILKDHELLNGVQDRSYVYFAHSFYPVADDQNVYAYTEYGVKIPSFVARDNVLGVQFHPEKSAEVGSTILHNLVGIVRK